MFGFYPAFVFSCSEWAVCVQEAIQKVIILEMTSALVFVLCLSAFYGGYIIALMRVCVLLCSNTNFSVIKKKVHVGPK